MKIFGKGTRVSVVSNLEYVPGSNPTLSPIPVIWPGMRLVNAGDADPRRPVWLVRSLSMSAFYVQL